MAEIKEALAMVSERIPKSKSPRMDICSVPNVQRVVNFAMDDGKMYFSERFRGTTSESSTICDLPLLFVNGFLSNLEKLTFDQLETFVPHMIQCSLSSMPLDTQPKWWPSNIEFCPRPVKPPKMSYFEWLKRLKMLVSNCYSYHGCEFALKLGFDRPLDQISLSGPHIDMSVGNISSHVTASFGMGYEGCHNMKVSRYRCFKCGSKFKEAREIRHHGKICPRVQSSTIPCNNISYPPATNSFNGLPSNKLNESRSRVRSVQPTVLNKLSLPVNQRKRLYYRTSGENTPLRITKENLTAAKWSPNVLLYDCFKSSLGLQRKSESGTLKNLPLSSINGEERTKLNSHQRQHSVSFKRKRKTAKSLLPLGYRKEVNKIYAGENINTCPSEDTLSWKEPDYDEKVEGDFPETTCDFQNNQESFMKCFGLIDTSNYSLPSTSNKKPLGNPIRYTGVPVSSPLGSLIFNRSRIPASVFLTKIEKVERYCSAKPMNISFPTSKVLQISTAWPVSWKNKNMGNCMHNYCYPLKKWWETPLLWENEVKRRNTYFNLLKLCKPCNVVLRRLSTVDIKLRTSLTVITRQVKKETFHNRQNLSKEFSLVPEIMKLTDKEIEAYTNYVSPVLKRLSVQEIKKYSK